MKYIVTWVLMTYVSSPCNFDPVKDEFGNELMPHSVSAVSCLTMETEHLSKEFDNRDSAFSFYNRCRIHPYDPKIDSILINK